MQLPRKLEWEDFEHAHQEKHPDWFWIVGIVSATIAILSIIAGNMLFAVIIIIASFTGAIHAKHHPRLIKFELNPRGIVIDSILYPYINLDSFWVNDDENKVLIKSKKLLMPYILLHLGDIYPEDARDYLLQHLTEEEHHEPLLQKLLEWLGF